MSTSDDGMIEGILQAKKIAGVVQCDHCGYWGEMIGYVSPDDTDNITFCCPECNSFERVTNIF